MGIVLTRGTLANQLTNHLLLGHFWVDTLLCLDQADQCLVVGSRQWHPDPDGAGLGLQPGSTTASG